MRAQICCAAQRPLRCGRLGRLLPGGLRETAWHGKPETLENAAPKANEAEAQQRANGRAPQQLLPCRFARASHLSCPRIGGGAATPPFRDPTTGDPLRFMPLWKWYEIVASALQDHRRATVIGYTLVRQGSGPDHHSAWLREGGSSVDNGSVFHPVRQIDSGEGYFAGH
jgi:hypothetical protein